MKEKKREKKKASKTDINKALIKKALGYDTEETVEEYAETDEGEIRLLKKKVTKKNVPPDMTALKILLDNDSTPINFMSDEQLEKEKQRLLKLMVAKNKKTGENQFEKSSENKTKL